MYRILLISNEKKIFKELSDSLIEIFPGSVSDTALITDGMMKAIINNPDIIFLSVDDESQNQYELLVNLRTNAATRKTPVFGISGEKSINRQFTCDSEYELDEIYTLPLNKKNLAIQIRSLLGQTSPKPDDQSDMPGEEDDLNETCEDLINYKRRHEGIFANTGHAIAIYSAVDEGEDFVFVEFNRSAELMEQVRKEDIIGKRVTEVFTSIKKIGLLDAFKRVWKTGVPEHHPVSEYKDSRISGWRENHVYKLPTNEIVAIYSDETKQKSAELALKESEERFRQLAENIQEVFWVVSPDWEEIYYISPAYEKIWGVSCASLYANPLSWLDKVVSEDKELVIAYLREKIDGDLSEIVFPEYRISLPDGSVSWISAKGYPVFNHKKEPYRVVGIAEDITEKKQSEKAFHAILEGTAGAIGQDFFDKMVREISEWLDCEIAIVGEITDSSRISSISMIIDGQLTYDFSYSIPGTPCSGTIRDGYCYYSDDIANIFPDIEYIKKIGAAGYVGVPLINAEDESIGVLIAISKKRLILPERAGEVMKILAARVSAELERKKIQEQKNQVETLLRQAQKMEAIGTLAGGIAHDFNNILQSIILNTELALFEDGASQGIQHRMDEVLRASKRATDLVKQILTFSRQSKIELKPLKIGLVIKEVLKMLRSSLPSTIDIVPQICKENDLVMADPTQIHQVVMNLCTNASHAMREKGGVLSVSLNTVDLPPDSIGRYPELEPGEYLSLTISDTGHGMDSITKERIFDPFFTTKERGEGTGLGLAVVYGIIKELKGTIRVESEINRWTDFTILLPRIRSTPKKDSFEARPIPGGSEVMLIIDDEEDLLTAQGKIFERLGYKVETNSSSISALEAFRKNPDAYDIVITDQTMPKMTGSTLAKELMSIKPDIPIILCTGFSDIVSEEDAKAIGIKEFVMKPIVVREIAEKVRAILG